MNDWGPVIGALLFALVMAEFLGLYFNNADGDI